MVLQISGNFFSYALNFNNIIGFFRFHADLPTGEAEGENRRGQSFHISPANPAFLLT
jgi:hypothetical protein